jgi:hypothetical protein
VKVVELVILDVAVTEGVGVTVVEVVAVGVIVGVVVALNVFKEEDEPVNDVVDVPVVICDDNDDIVEVDDPVNDVLDVAVVVCDDNDELVPVVELLGVSREELVCV